MISGHGDGTISDGDRGTEENDDLEDLQDGKLDDEEEEAGLMLVL